MDSAIYALLGVVIGGGMVALGAGLLRAMQQGDNDEMINTHSRAGQRCMDMAAAFEAGREHALWLKELEQFERHQYITQKPEQRIVVVVASPEQAAALARM